MNCTPCIFFLKIKNDLLQIIYIQTFGKSNLLQKLLNIIELKRINLILMLLIKKSINHNSSPKFVLYDCNYFDKQITSIRPIVQCAIQLNLCADYIHVKLALKKWCRICKISHFLAHLNNWCCGCEFCNLCAVLPW